MTTGQAGGSTAAAHTGYARYPFRGRTGYVVTPWVTGVGHELVTIRHSSSVQPWVDSDVHLHRDSEEYYLLLAGELRLLVGGSAFSLKPREILMVKPRVPHAVLGGHGPIEHFVVRMPALDDRVTVGSVVHELSALSDEGRRELRQDWGYRVPLAQERYQNCWLFGNGQARFRSDRMCLAYLNLPTDESADASWRNYPHRLHLHRESWEYYTVFAGSKTLQVEGQSVEIRGEILEIPPGTKHVARAIHTPYEGFTFRVPRLDDKVEF